MHLELLKVVIKIYLQQTLTIYIYSIYKGVCVHLMNIYATQKGNVFICIFLFFLLSGKCCV